VNTEFFKAKLAGTVAAKAGITSQQAKQIVQCVIGLRGRTTIKRVNLVGLGEVTVINRRTTGLVDYSSTGTIKTPYETIVMFNVGNEPKTLTFQGLEKATKKSEKPHKWTQLEEIVTLGGLEGDPDVPIRRPKKGSETIKAAPEGDPDTGARRRERTIEFDR
jgi:nucleoid DNA-binding protein